MAARLEAEAEGLRKVGRWSRERLENEGRWLDELTAASRRETEDLVAGVPVLAAEEAWPGTAIYCLWAGGIYGFCR